MSSSDLRAFRMSFEMSGLRVDLWFPPLPKGGGGFSTQPNANPLSPPFSKGQDGEASRGSVFSGSVGVRKHLNHFVVR